MMVAYDEPKEAFGAMQVEAKGPQSIKVESDVVKWCCDRMEDSGYKCKDRGFKVKDQRLRVRTEDRE